MNWTSIILAFFTALPATIMAAAAYRKASSTHDLVNSRMTELLELTRKASADEATLIEKAAQHVRAGEQAVEKAKTETSTKNESNV